MDGRTGSWNVYYANSTDEGRTWSPNVRVTTADEMFRASLNQAQGSDLILKAAASSKSVEAVVPESNLDAQLLLRKCGMKASEILNSRDEPRYKFSSCQKESF